MADNLPVPRELISKAREPLEPPCVDCPYFYRFPDGRERLWQKGKCQRGWLPKAVTIAALTNRGAPWGMEIRKLSGMCPYYFHDHSVMFTIYLHVSPEEAGVIGSRIELMLETLPVLDAPVVASKSWV